MPSRHRKPKVPKQGDIRGIEVVSELDFANQCGKTIGSILGVKQIGFAQFQNLTVSWKYRLSGPGWITVYVRGNNYHVIPFFESQNFAYWIGATLHIEHTGLTDYLAQISIIIIRGSALDATRPLLRAEWDCRPSDPNNKHAQPHWHVYSEPIEITPARQPFEALIQTEEFRPATEISQANKWFLDIWEGGEDFHFAMAAEWIKRGRGIAHDDWDEAGALRWLDGCLSYIRDQFEYLASKGGV